MRNRIKVFFGNASRKLAHNVYALLSIELGNARVDRFSDGEVDVQILEDVRNADVFIINSLHPPAENFFEAGLLVEASHDASAGRFCLFFEKSPYGR